MREFSKLNYLSYDTLFVKIGAVLFSKNIPKVGQFSVSRKNTEILESTNIPISWTPCHEFIFVKTYQILYKQNKNQVHPNDTKGLKNDL